MACGRIGCKVLSGTGGDWASILSLGYPKVLCVLETWLIVLKRMNKECCHNAVYQSRFKMNLKMRGNEATQ